MTRSVLAAISVALLTTLLALHATSSSAQKREGDKMKEDQAITESKAKERKAGDASYKSAIERLPDQKYDPWRGMR